MAVDRQVSALVSGSSSVTCNTLRSAEMGVRSSWEALATKCRCASNAVSSRGNRSSRVSPRSLNSSCGPARARRSCRLVEEILRARAGDGPDRSEHPAGHKPAGQKGEYGHDGQSESRVDEQLVRVDSALGGFDGPYLSQLMHGLCQLIPGLCQLVLVLRQLIPSLCQLTLVLCQLMLDLRQPRKLGHKPLILSRKSFQLEHNVSQPLLSLS